MSSHKCLLLVAFLVVLSASFFSLGNSNRSSTDHHKPNHNSTAKPATRQPSVHTSPPSAPAGLERGSVAILVGVFLVLALVVFCAMGLLFYRYYFMSKSLAAGVAAAPTLSNTNRGIKQTRPAKGLADRPDNEEADFGEPVSIKTRGRKRSSGRRMKQARASSSKRSKTKGKSKTKTKIKRKQKRSSRGSRRNGAARRVRSSPMKDNSMSRASTVSRKVQSTRSSSERSTQSSRVPPGPPKVNGKGKGKGVGEQTMLFNQGLQYYKAILKSIHSVKSVSQYFDQAKK